MVMALCLGASLISQVARERESAEQMERVQRRSAREVLAAEEADADEESLESIKELGAITVNIGERGSGSRRVEALMSKNSDIVGWINIPGTVVDYPVMYREGDSDYYLAHDFYKKSDRNGLPVLDGRNSADMSEAVTLIHGHNLRSGNLFGALMDYQDEAFLYEHQDIMLDTRTDSRHYEIIAVCITTAAGEADGYSFYEHLEPSSDEEAQELISHAKSASIHRIAATAIPGDELLMLSTCEYTKEDGRLLVIARRIR